MSTPDEDAARRALVSSGVVGLTTALLTKGAGVKLEISLPIALAAGITLDYAVNRRHAEKEREKRFESVRIAGNALGDFIREDLGQTAYHSAWGQEYDGDLWRSQLLTGVIGMLGGATMVLGGYELMNPAVPRDPAAGIVDLPRNPGVVGWGLYQAAELANDFAAIAQGFYGLLRPRLRNVIKAVSDLFGRGEGGLTAQEVEERVAEVLPEDDIQLNQMLQRRADEVMNQRRGAQLFVPPGMGIDEIARDAPSLPDYGGQMMVLQSDSGEEVAMLIGGRSVHSKTSIGLTKTGSDFSVASRLVPVVILPDSEIRDMADVWTDIDVQALVRDAARSAHEDEQQRLYGGGHSTSSEEDSD